MQLLVVPQVGPVFGHICAAGERTGVAADRCLRAGRDRVPYLVLLGSASLGSQLDQRGVGTNDLQLQVV